MARPRFLPDNFMLILLALIVAASVLPVRGVYAGHAATLTNAAIALLFFLHGAKLPLQSVIAGLGHWRLHSLVFACTFLLFPLLAVLLKPVLLPLVGPDLYRGLLYMSALPSTVQSAIAFTSVARGNVPAAICAAATSSLLGVFVTPLLVVLLLGQAGHGLSMGDAVLKIMLQLLLPFVLGQIARPWIGAWVDRNKSWLKHVDQWSIYLVVYTAFSKAVVDGLWSKLPLAQLLLLAAACAGLLFIVLQLTWRLGRRLGFSLEDRITLLFAGSKKSLATGVPMAQVLFAGSAMGAVLLPIMVFHQIQLLVCAVLSKRFAARPAD
ncbi:MAG: bile acid:sodium symporter [Hydrogenophaga sp.]|jgi:sodium/bile acid cotransporter 7|uniref:bile acid:sodium symporter family protein n=1 Tax=Hydrogenophaga sp. TaxID=1904254 RepID=UPI0026072C91|nr:bile acid:sodium symporter family protein [Hydrogenophaga sp.]MDD3784047.1 bile acid:sodium symporter [Hydrogenophaga sp.]MDX9968372.1 bile acid:sodium symporter family protein [Hydrogenophaga sp.]